MVFPVVFFPSVIPSAGGASTLSDIMFLAVKESDGKLVHDEGTLSATGDVATLTASAGKDMYLAKAKVSARLESVANVSANVVVKLKSNGTTVGTWACLLVAGTNSTGTSTDSYEFAMSGIKVAAGQTIKLEAITVDADIEVSGELVCWQEDIDADSQI